MPRGDRTGPAGEGPMTGRQLGYGAGYDSPGFTKSFGQRCGWGSGYYGRGRGRGYFWQGQNVRPTDIPEEATHMNELYSIKAELEALKQNISSILKTLNKKEPGKKDK